MKSLKDLKEIASGYSILYVEDDKDIANNLISYLSKLFKEVVYAQNGEEALSLYENDSYDIVITDIMMPKIDGLEMAKRIKEINPNQNIIIVSAYAEIDNFLASIKIGIDGYIIKPINYADMNNTLYKTVSKLKALTENQSYEKKFEKLYSEAQRDNSELQQFIDVLDKVALVSKTDLDGTITYVNHFFEEVSGFSKEELIGNRHRLIRHEEMPKSFYQDLWETIKTGEPWEGTIKNKSKEGNTYFAHAVILPIFDLDKNITEFMGISFLTTDEEIEKREFKKKVMTNYMEFKKTNINAMERIGGLDKELSQLKEEYQLYKNQMEKINSKYKKSKRQLDFYEKGLKQKDSQYAKILEMQRNNLQKISESHKLSLTKIEKQRNEIYQLQEEHDLKAKEIIKLNDELNEQHAIIIDLRDTIKNIDEDKNKS